MRFLVRVPSLRRPVLHLLSLRMRAKGTFCKQKQPKPCQNWSEVGVLVLL
jgi:hypothetical protein